MDNDSVRVAPSTRSAGVIVLVAGQAVRTSATGLVLSVPNVRARALCLHLDYGWFAVRIMSDWS